MTVPVIDSTYLQDVLGKLLSIPSPSGMTDDVVHAVGAELDAMGAPYHLTRRGAIRAVLNGPEPTSERAVAAHLDTLGAMVKRLKDNGRVGLVPIGTWSSRFAEGARVSIHTENENVIRGTVLPLKASGHTYHKEIDDQPVQWDNLEIRMDADCHSNHDIWDLGIRVGDFVSVDPGTEFTDTGYINSRHLDDKAGVACILAAAKALLDAGCAPSITSHLLFTVTEEVGSGAAHIVPEAVGEMLSIDNGTMAPEQNTCEFGATLAMQDSSGPFDRALTRHLIQLCRVENLEFGRDIFNHYRSDAAAAQEAGHDVRTALVCFGLDASHGFERVHMRSLQTVAQLVAAYLVSPPLDTGTPTTGSPDHAGDGERHTQRG